MVKLLQAYTKNGWDIEITHRPSAQEDSVVKLVFTASASTTDKRKKNFFESFNNENAIRAEVGNLRIITFADEILKNVEAKLNKLN